MAPVVDLTDLQNVVGKYADQHRLIVVAGPVSAAALVRTFLTRSKLVSAALVGGGAILAIQDIAGPYLKLMGEQFGYLRSLFGG